MTQDNGLLSLMAATRELRQRAETHEVYRSLETLEQVRLFMEHHVFAVWDFMSLVKSLQTSLTSVSLPWLPGSDPLSRRLINEIVLDEESDEDGEGGYLSHFELYLRAMAQCGAETSRIEAFVKLLRAGETVQSALIRAGAPPSARAFVETTWSIIESKAPHRVAAAFTLGREQIVPEMFKRVVGTIESRFPGRTARFGYYLERHINIDKDRHEPMAALMLGRLCDGDPGKWREAAEAAETALRARIKLWDEVLRTLAL